MLRAILLLASVCALCQARAVGQSARVLRSRDGASQARIVLIGKRGFEAQESRVEVRDAKGRLKRFRSFASPDGEHGYGVIEAMWTEDDQFFVFQVDSSGGHQPWHQPTYFYSRRANRFFNLGAFIGPTTRGLRRAGGGAVKVKRYNFETGGGDYVRVRLNRLLPAR